MDNRLPTLASAVVVPNLTRSPTPPPLSQEATNGHTNALKRRASGSPTSENGAKDDLNGEDAYAKRARLTSDLNNTNDRPNSGSDHTLESASSTQARKRASADPDADRKRGRRLFGSLLGTLSQSGNAPSAAQQRRVEAERRQREKLAAQQNYAASSSAERPGSKQRTPEELEALKRERAIQQERWETEARTMRHTNMRAQAGFLQTATQPKLFWLPYELTSAEEEQVKVQKEQVERDIEDEIRMTNRTDNEADSSMQIDDGQESKEDSNDQNDNGERHRNAPDQEDEAMDADQDEKRHGEEPQSTDTTSRFEADAGESEAKQNGEHDGKEDEDEDMVLNRDAEEDPVIY